MKAKDFEEEEGGGGLGGGGGSVKWRFLQKKPSVVWKKKNQII